VSLFGSVRDGWIAEDLAGWLAPNQIYPGVADAVRQAPQHDDVYVVTTKQVGGWVGCVWSMLLCCAEDEGGQEFLCLTLAA
jgi:hypothetical protein